jgi:hypothetical protein
VISVTRRTERRADGSVARRVYVRVTGESLGPLDVLPPRVPELPRGMTRTRQRVRVNRSGTWAVWGCVDVKGSR